MIALSDREFSSNGRYCQNSNNAIIWAVFLKGSGIMAYPGSPLKVGVKKAVVETLQSRLKALGMDDQVIGGLDIDGDFGPDTELAVKTFQARSVDDTGRPLDVDGVVGPATWGALFGEAPRAARVVGDSLLGKAIELARAEVGVREEPLGSNRGPRVDQYLRAVGLSPTGGSYAWCAAFAYFCFDEAARALDMANPVPKTAGVHEMWRRAGQSRLLRLSAIQARANPERVKPGQLFFLDHGGGLGHMGLVVGVQGVRLVTVEGNTTDISGSREGIGVFERRARQISQISLGFCDPAQTV